MPSFAFTRVPLVVALGPFLLRAAVFGASEALKRLTRVHERAWEALRAGDLAETLGSSDVRRRRGSSADDEYGVLHRARGERYLFAGPALGWMCWASFQQIATHLPPYMEALTRLVAVRLPRMAAAAIRHRLANDKGEWIPPVPDDVAYRVVVQTPLILIARLCENRLVLELPTDLNVRWLWGGTIAGARFVFDTETGRVVEASQHGVSLSSKNGLSVSELALAYVHLAATAWAHPKTHVLAERCAREIVRSNVRELEPSSRYVVSLHEGLLYSPMSPGGSRLNPLHQLLDMKSLLDELRVPMKHDLSASKVKLSRYFAFLVASRPVFGQCVSRHNLRVDVEALFHNIVVHSIDHGVFHAVLKDVLWFSIDGTGSVRSYFASQAFTEMWIPHMANPYDRERLVDHVSRDDCHPFYADLYKSLRELDGEYADMVVLSCSW